VSPPSGDPPATPPASPTDTPSQTRDGLDLTELEPNVPRKIDAPKRDSELPLNSELWASIVRPFAMIVFGLIASVLVLPFLIIWFTHGQEPKDRLDYTIRWATTVLPAIIGFGSAAATYYFGTSGSKSDNK